MRKQKKNHIQKKLNKHLIWITLLIALTLDVLQIDAATIIASSASIFAYVTGYLTYNPDLHDTNESSE